MGDAVRVLGLGYVGFDAPDLDAWARFGQDVLGMEVSRTSTADVLRLKMDVRVYRVALHRSDRGGLRYMGWEVQDIPELERAAALLRARGFEVSEGSRSLADERLVASLLQLKDPSGNDIELYVGARTEEARRFTSPAGVRFVTGDQGLGHVTMMASNYQESFDFYHRLLGFGISDFLVGEGLQAAFMGPNPRHHSLALLDSRGRSDDLHHLMVEVDDLTDVGRAYDKCIDGAAPISITMGKHWNDHMTSFYVQSPAGFDVEYGWGARVVDRANWPAIQGNGEISVWGHRPTNERAAHMLGRSTWITEFASLRGQGVS